MTINDYKETQVERGCVSSIAEIAVAKTLKSLKVDYKREVEFGLLKNHYFDFYLPVVGIIVEFDGKQHRTPDNIYDKGDGNAFQVRLDRDRIKNKFCKEHGILMVRIRWSQLKDLKGILSKILRDHHRGLTSIAFNKHRPVVISTIKVKKEQRKVKLKEKRVAKQLKICKKDAEISRLNAIIEELQKK